MSTASCSDLASNTINYAYLMNAKVVPSIILMGWVISKIVAEMDPIVMRHFKKLRKATIRCAKAYAGGAVLGNICKKFCNFYHFNATSPAIEGY